MNANKAPKIELWGKKWQVASIQWFANGELCSVAVRMSDKPGELSIFYASEHVDLAGLIIWN